MENIKASADPAEKAAIRLYADIEKDFFQALEDTGVVFESRDFERLERAELIKRLEAIGARVRNGGASVVLGDLSRGCVACTGSCPSRTFAITNNCHRDCYFCFNPNQRDFAYYCEHDFPWRKQLEALANEAEAPDCIALSGGEPLLRPDETVAFFAEARAKFPDAHLRIYTSGDLLSETLLGRLRDAGMEEIRFSIKTDDSPTVREKIFALMEIACKYIPTVMVEMPVIPGTEELMKTVLKRLDGMGAFGINLLEFTYPMWNWEAFDSRDFKLKNPPFDVVFDYTYAGSLAVAGSEELALSLMLWAHDEGLGIGMHYCSLENKHRGQIRKANEPYAVVNANYAFDYDDFFLKTISVYGKDCESARKALVQVGCKEYMWDKGAKTLSFHPKWLPIVKEKLLSLNGKNVRFCVSYNVAVKQDGKLRLRELKVVPNGEMAQVQLNDETRLSDEKAGCAIS